MKYNSDPSHSRYTIGIIGLGLMGGSMALALRGFRGARILGADRDDLVCRRAEAAGTVHQAATDPGEVISQADLLLFCVYARHIPAIVQAHAHRFRPGCVAGDICGVKVPLYDTLLPLLPPGVDYVGLHPMAGKERDGYENAETALYRGCGFLITPTPRSSEAGIALMRELAAYLGAARLSIIDPAQHDEIIAYTSDLMHASAAALCLHPHPGMQPAFTAGAFRDCTRVADINADAWTELLLDNRHNTAAALSRYIEDLTSLRTALQAQDRTALRALLQRAGDNKRALLQR